MDAGELLDQVVGEAVDAPLRDLMQLPHAAESSRGWSRRCEDAVTAMSSTTDIEMA
ncbi:MAG TPA: hypothetical protein VID68_07770 [Solirubrobacteraceae bacterium]